MNRYLVMTAAALAGVVVLAGTPAGATALPGSGAAAAWGKAEEVPGTAALNQGGAAWLLTVACASAGNCSAGGYYTDSSGHQQVFVVSEAAGSWGKAEEVPGTAVLNKGGYAWLSQMSCASAGNCSAGGYYTDGSGHYQAYLVSQVGGTWGKAEEVPGTAVLNTGGLAWLGPMSCPSVGDCSAGGYYSSSTNGEEPFVISETGGTWGKAKEVPGAAALDTGGGAQLDSLSCASAGNCSAGGYYLDSSHHQQVFVVSQVGGAWGKAEEVPGVGGLNAGGSAFLDQVSCGSAGNCSAGGQYYDASHHYQAFVVGQVAGSWGTAEEVPGTAALNANGDATVQSVSCAAAGDCSGGGYYDSATAGVQLFVVGESGGTWGTARAMPGIAALNQGGNAWLSQVWCASAGNCSGGGWYTDSSSHKQVFVVSQVGGSWGKAEELPGSATLNAGGNAQISSVSCASAGHCAAAGYYADSSGHTQALVASQT
jgi:hypothetical protein